MPKCTEYLRVAGAAKMLEDKATRIAYLFQQGALDSNRCLLLSDGTWLIPESYIPEIRKALSELPKGKEEASAFLDPSKVYDQIFCPAKL